MKTNSKMYQLVNAYTAYDSLGEPERKFQTVMEIFAESEEAATKRFVEIFKGVKLNIGKQHHVWEKK